MQRLKNYAILSLTIAVLVFPATTSSQTPEYPPECSPLRTSRSEQPQGPSTPATKFFKSKKPIPNRYIVVLNDDVVSDDAPLEVRRARVTAIASCHAQTYGGKFDYVYETALKGYAIELPNEAAAIAISNLPEVRWVEEDAFGELGSNYQGLPIKQQAVCRGKSVPVSLMEHPFGLKMRSNTVAPIANRIISGQVSDLNGLVTDARIILQSFKDEKCAKLFLNKKYSEENAKKLHLLARTPTRRHLIKTGATNLRTFPADGTCSGFYGT